MNAFDVSMTAFRPAGLPLFLLGRNNLAPSLALDDDALFIKVVRTNRVPLSDIRSVRKHAGLRAPYLVIATSSWEYVVHFAKDGEIDRLSAALNGRIGEGSAALPGAGASAIP